MNFRPAIVATHILLVFPSLIFMSAVVFHAQPVVSELPMAPLIGVNDEKNLATFTNCNCCLGFSSSTAI